ncbi:exonuclease [Tieghemostelium lacteum]|uniref:Exonuclease n=1 Tax=Tieghemostelium lacteum TaxID=361077 RepID=A0A151ZHW6_TIELA|nr:exonuclease [Tieghemostelium lacteum]|eukprot:KYQ93505.1 exonuclease [Tieghemostelium lacteum]
MSIRDKFSTPTQSNQMPHSALEQDIVFIAKTDNTQDISKILSTIVKHDSETKKKDSSAHNLFVTCKISPQTISFSYDEGKHFQANCSLKSTFFEEYKCELPVQSASNNQDGTMLPTAYSFKVNLLMIIDGLNIFGSEADNNTSVQFVYGGYGKPFILLLNENGVMATCSIKTMDTEEPNTFDLVQPVSNKIVIDSESLLEAFGELDYSSSRVRITLSPDAPFFKVQTTGNMGNFSMEFNPEKKAEEIFESCELNQSISHLFQLPLIKPCIKALAHGSAKTRLTLTVNGILQFQHILQTGSHLHPVIFTVVAISPHHYDENDENMQMD